MLGSEAEDRDSLLNGTIVEDWENVVPVAATVGDKIEARRQWAPGWCLSADRAGVYPMREREGVR